METDSSQEAPLITNTKSEIIFKFVGINVD